MVNFRPIWRAGPFFNFVSALQRVCYCLMFTLPSHAGYGISKTDRGLIISEEISLFENYAGLLVRVDSDLYTVPVPYL